GTATGTGGLLFKLSNPKHNPGNDSQRTEQNSQGNESSVQIDRYLIQPFHSEVLDCGIRILSFRKNTIYNSCKIYSKNVWKIIFLERIMNCPEYSLERGFSL
ncbi:MAG: hypothetical protein ACPHKR_01675, partial [bacterium]